MNQPLCAYCGAHAPALAPGQTTFICAYCGKQSALGAVGNGVAISYPPAPIRDEGPRIGRIIGTIFVVIGLLVIGGGVVAWKATASLRTPEPQSCTSYSGSSTRGTWSGCPSGATIELSCSSTFPKMPGMPPSMMGNELTCHCLRDGAEEWFFDAQSAPPLSSRADAERVGSASCKRW